VGGTLIGVNVAVPMYLDAQGLFPQWEWQYHALIGFLAFAAFMAWIIYDKQRQLYDLTSGSNLEVRALPTNSLNPYYGLAPGQSVTAIFGLQIINHSENRKAYVERVCLVLKEMKFPLRRKVLFSKPLEKRSPQSYYNDELKEIEIEPQAKTPEYPIIMHKAIPIVKPFPRKSKLVLVLEMVGYKRKIEHELAVFMHDPKQVPDIPDSQTE
jgi:hypothetical protein